MMPPSPAALVATLGTRPQVITIALDLLLDLKVPIEEVLVVHTASARSGRDLMDESLRELRRQFPLDQKYLYHGREEHPCRLRLLPLELDNSPIDDIHDDREARVVFTAIFNRVQELKKQRYTIHLSIAGGRKSMSVYGMAAAQLLFDTGDQLWHLFSSPEFERQNLMHPRSPDDARLVGIPVLPISTVFPGMITLLTSQDPLSVLERKQSFLVMEQQRNRSEFLARLTASERRLVDLMMQAIVNDNRSLSNSELARKLILTPRVVANRLGDIYLKLEQFLGLPSEEQVDRTVLVYYLTPYYLNPA